MLFYASEFSATKFHTVKKQFEMIPEKVGVLLGGQWGLRGGRLSDQEAKEEKEDPDR